MTHYLSRPRTRHLIASRFAQDERLLSFARHSLVLLASQDVMVVLPEPMCFVADVLQKSQRRGVSAQPNRLRVAGSVDLLIALRQRNQARRLLAEQPEHFLRGTQLSLAAVDEDDVDPLFLVRSLEPRISIAATPPRGSTRNRRRRPPSESCTGDSPAEQQAVDERRSDATVSSPPRCACRFPRWNAASSPIRGPSADRRGPSSARSETPPVARPCR